MSGKKNEALIIGCGARTPVGCNAPASSIAVRAGIAAMQDHPYLTDKHGVPMVIAADAELPPNVCGIQRLAELAITPAIEALSPLADLRAPLPPVCVFLAFSEPRPGRPADLENVLGRSIQSRLTSTIEIQETNYLALGNAGGLTAMAKAKALISDGKADLCLVGGVDSYLEVQTLEWLDSLDQLHSENTIYGFCPAEAAGFCLLASREFTERHSLSAALKLYSAASAAEANRIKTETVCIGEGLSAAFVKSLIELPNGACVSHTICDLNGEPYRGDEYGFAMMRSAGRFSEHADFETPADSWGDVGAAAGPLFVVLAFCDAEKNRREKGSFILLWASSEGGQRACALLQTNQQNSQD